MIKFKFPLQPHQGGANRFCRAWDLAYFEVQDVENWRDRGVRCRIWTVDGMRVLNHFCQWDSEILLSRIEMWNTSLVGILRFYVKYIKMLRNGVLGLLDFQIFPGEHAGPAPTKLLHSVLAINHDNYQTSPIHLFYGKGNSENSLEYFNPENVQEHCKSETLAHSTVHSLTQLMIDTPE